MEVILEKTRFLQEVLTRVRSAVAAPLFVRASVLFLMPIFATQSVHAEELSSIGVGPMIDFSSSASAAPSREDVETYRRIFAIQKKGQWKKADRLIETLEDRSLMGHVLARRYLHPTRYRSSYKELKDWLADYADHPQAEQIHQLALRRRPANWKYPNKPVRKVGGAIKAGKAAARKRAPKPRRKYLTKAQSREVWSLGNRIRNQVRKGWTLAAKRNLQSARVKTLFPVVDYDRAAALLGAGYFAAGRDEWALEWLRPAAERSGKYLPDARWWAGLAAWRLDRMEEAAEYFEALASYDYLDDWQFSAANFWAARANLILRRPDRVSAYLEAAAEKRETFYGVLARRLLGRSLGFHWDVPDVAAGMVDEIAEDGRGRRVLALMRVGEQSLAEREMRLLLSEARPDQVLGVLALASRSGLSSLALRLNDRLFPAGDGLDMATYPVPVWAPRTGFRVDRALIFALVRQESRFNPRAKSHAGARGLMQLMPSTASFIAQDRKYRESRYPYLYRPELNLELGQKYIEYLLEEGGIEGDLFRMTAAWNAGPGNLQKWYRQWQAKQKTEDLQDSLIFLESIPLRETRDFVERVLTNFWIYRDRFGQPTPSLDAVAAGRWPEYIPLDDEMVAAVRDESN